METSRTILPPMATAKASGERPQRDIRAFTSSAIPDRQQQAPLEDQGVCWICLDGAQPAQCLMQACRCPRLAHAACLARWQLQSAGSRRETHCEFCDQQLPDWKATLTPKCGANAPAVMNVNFDNRTYSFEVKPGADGYKEFTEAIRQAFNLPDDSELNITFTCDEPSAVPVAEPHMTAISPVVVEPALPLAHHTGSLLTLQGAGAYDAAVHCASVSAARRQQQQLRGGQRFAHPQAIGHEGIALRPPHQRLLHDGGRRKDEYGGRREGLVKTAFRTVRGKFGRSKNSE